MNDTIVSCITFRQFLFQLLSLVLLSSIIALDIAGIYLRIGKLIIKQQACFMFRSNQYYMDYFLQAVFKIIFIVSISACSKGDIKKVNTTLPPINTDNNLPVGASANDFLSASKYNSVVIEIQYVDGFLPESESINNLLLYLYELINKNAGIHYYLKQITSPFKNELTLNDIATIEKNNRTVFTSEGRLGVYILFTDGYYSQGNIIGLSYRNTSICLFGKSISENSGGVGQPSKATLETFVIQHEFGHLLGLVNMGTPMLIYHENTVQKNHCNNSACLMYNTIGSIESLKYLFINPSRVLDANCKADLRANGGK